MMSVTKVEDLPDSEKKKIILFVNNKIRSDNIRVNKICLMALIPLVIIGGIVLSFLFDPIYTQNQMVKPYNSGLGDDIIVITGEKNSCSVRMISDDGKIIRVKISDCIIIYIMNCDKSNASCIMSNIYRENIPYSVYFRDESKFSFFSDRYDDGDYKYWTHNNPNGVLFFSWISLLGIIPAILAIFFGISGANEYLSTPYVDFDLSRGKLILANGDEHLICHGNDYKKFFSFYDKYLKEYLDECVDKKNDQFNIEKCCELTHNI